jgi:hypothetical protein
MIDFANIETFLEQIITHDGKQLDRHIVIRPEDFQMSTISRTKIFRFDIFLLIDGIPVPRSEQAVHMATPSEGIFVIYELKDMKIPWQEINGCRIRTFDSKNNVLVDTTIKFYGLRRRPKRCVLMENDNLSRAIVAWHTRPPTDAEIKADRMVEQKARERKVEVPKQEEEDIGITILPPASLQEVSSVADILARLRGEEGDIDPVLPR